MRTVVKEVSSEPPSVMKQSWMQGPKVERAQGLSNVKGCQL